MAVFGEGIVLTEYLQVTDSSSGEVSGQLQLRKLATGGSSTMTLWSSTAFAKVEADKVEAEGSVPATE